MELLPQQIAQLDELTAPEPEYPRSLLASEFFQTMMFGEARENIVLRHNRR